MCSRKDMVERFAIRSVALLKNLVFQTPKRACDELFYWKNRDDVDCVTCGDPRLRNILFSCGRQTDYRTGGYHERHGKDRGGDKLCAAVEVAAERALTASVLSDSY